MKDLSCYTIARNCTDGRDLQCGIDELNTYLSKRPDAPKTVRIRLHRLHQKLEKLTSKTNQP